MKRRRAPATLHATQPVPDTVDQVGREPSRRRALKGPEARGDRFGDAAGIDSGPRVVLREALYARDNRLGLHRLVSVGRLSRQRLVGLAARELPIERRLEPGLRLDGVVHEVVEQRATRFELARFAGAVVAYELQTMTLVRQSREADQHVVRPNSWGVGTRIVRLVRGGACPAASADLGESRELLLELRRAPFDLRDTLALLRDHVGRRIR